MDILRFRAVSWYCAALCLVMSPLSQADSITIDYEVSGLDSLYFTDWGHAYNVSGAGNQYDALGRGVAAGQVGYAFTSGQELDVSAWSCVRDAGQSCTGADGYNSLFRGLSVYSLIGIWSNSATDINPVGDAFSIGSALNLITPDSIGLLYLFLAENDGIFADNYAWDHYHVSISTSAMTPSAVPVPAAAWLFGSGIVGLFGVVKRRKKT